MKLIYEVSWFRHILYCFRPIFNDSDLKLWTGSSPDSSPVWGRCVRGRIRCTRDGKVWGYDSVKSENDADQVLLIAAKNNERNHHRALPPTQVAMCVAGIGHLNAG